MVINGDPNFILTIRNVFLQLIWEKNNIYSLYYINMKQHCIHGNSTIFIFIDRAILMNTL